MTTILRNAERRGEIEFGELPERVVTLPIDLVRLEVLTTHSPLSDEAILEIVDTIFLPLMRKNTK